MRHGQIGLPHRTEATSDSIAVVSSGRVHHGTVDLCNGVCRASSRRVTVKVNRKSTPKMVAVAILQQRVREVTA